MKRLPIKPRDFMSTVDDKILDLLLNEMKTSEGEYLNEVVSKLRSMIVTSVMDIATRMPVLDEQDKEDLLPLLLFQLLQAKHSYKENPRFWIYNTLKIVISRIVADKRLRRNAKTFYFDVEEDGAIADEIGKHYYCSPSISNDSVTDIKHDSRVEQRQDIVFDKRNKTNGGKGR